MPCDTFALQARQRRERERAIKELEDDIAAGRVQVVANPVDGSLTIVEWDLSAVCASGMHESCAMAQIVESDDWAVQSVMQGAGISRAATLKRHGH